MKWKKWVLYPIYIRKARRALVTCKIDPAQRGGMPPPCSLGLDLYTDQLLIDCGRHPACLAATAGRLGRDVFLRCTKMMLASIARTTLGLEFLSMSNVHWLDPTQSFPLSSLILGDVDWTTADRPLSNRRYARMLIGRELLEGVPVMPYPMFPIHIAGSSDEIRSELRHVEKAGLFFAGNQDQQYGCDSMQERFGILPRLQMLNTLRTHFPTRIEPRSANGRADRIVLRNSATDPISSEQWLSVLSQHRFFLCCPGASQPVCHNLIEAMSVGTIPILEYADRLQPNLVDGENAICFEGVNGLVEAIRRIDELTDTQLNLLTRGAAEYFDRNLSGEQFLSDVLDHGLLDAVGAVVMPFHDTNLFDPKALPTHWRVAA